VKCLSQFHLLQLPRQVDKPLYNNQGNKYLPERHKEP